MLKTLMNIATPIDSGEAYATDLHQVLRLADKSYERGDLPAARALLHRARHLAPAECRILSALGSLDYQLGQFELAAQELSEAARLAPDFQGIHTQLAATWLRLGKMPEFFGAIEHSLRLNPSDVNALRLLAKGHMDEARWYEAARACHRLLYLDGRDREALMTLGKCFFALNELEMAQLTYERVLELCPDDLMAGQNLRLIRAKIKGQADPADDNPDGDIVVLAV